MAGNQGAAAPPPNKGLFNLMNDKLMAGAARLNGGEYQDVDVAIVKATNHDEVPPKEKHVKTLKEAVASGPSRKKVLYIIHDLYERVRNSGEDWLVVLKGLMVYHRLMKADGVGNFKMEMVKYKEKRKLNVLLRLDNFTDHSKKEAWDYSAWIRAYSIYLDDRLEVFKSASFDLERDVQSGETKLKTAQAHELLNMLPYLQGLMQRILGCVPEGAAVNSPVITESLKWVLSECFKLYRAISEGVINLADHCFEMDRIDAKKALDIYREAINITERLQEFFAKIQNMPAGRSLEFPQLAAPPEDFLEQIEAYAKGAPGPAGDNGEKKAELVTTRIGTIMARGIVTRGISGISSTDDGNKSEQSGSEGPSLLNFDAINLDSTPATSQAAPSPATNSGFEEFEFGSFQQVNPAPAAVVQTSTPPVIAPPGVLQPPNPLPVPPAPGAGQMNLLDGWGGVSVPSAGTQSAAPAQDPFGTFAAPVATPVPAPAPAGFGTIDPFQPQPPPQQSATGNPFASGNGSSVGGIKNVASQFPGAPPSRPAMPPQPGYVQRISDPFGDLSSDLMNKKPAQAPPGAPMRGDGAKAGGMGNMQPVAGFQDPFGSVTPGGAPAGGGNPFGNATF